MEIDVKRTAPVGVFDYYYGANAFYDIREHLSTAGKGEFAMTAFLLGNTLSKNGTVSRGICETKNGYLEKVTEFTKIYPDGSYEKDGCKYTFASLRSYVREPAKLYLRAHEAIFVKG